MTQIVQNPVKPLTITIDTTEYTIEKRPFYGQELRAIPNPDVPQNRDLWLEVPGPKDDELIVVNKTYEIRNHSIFYTAPTTINPGSE